MAHAAMLLLTYAALVSQVSLRESLAVSGIAPDFLSLVVVVAAFGLRGASAIVWAAIGGLLADCLSSSSLGLQMLVATLVVAFIQTCIGVDWRRSGFVQALVGCAMILVLISSAQIAQLIMNGQPVVAPRILPPLAATAIYSSGLGIVLRMFWKLALRMMPARPTESQPRTSNRWDALNR